MTNQSAKRKSAALYDRISIKTKAGRQSGWFDDRNRKHDRRWLESHRVKAYDAIAYDAEVIDQLAELGCQVLENNNPETGHKYRCAFVVIREHGIPFNFGHGDQIALPLRYWVEFDASGRQVEAAPTATPEPVDVQLGLFDGVPA